LAKNTDIARLPLSARRSIYAEALRDRDREALRALCRGDLFFLLVVGCNRPDADREWIFERCREVEDNPDGFLDLWAREHFKSSIITFALTIQDILNDPEVTVGIFSHTRGIAKGFLGQIMRELESNEFLKWVFSDILWPDPKNQAPKWSQDDGIIVKRAGNPRESTVEAWGLVDGQPTGRHFTRLVYDDVVTVESVTTPEQIKKTTYCLELSFNLGTEGGKRRAVGTRYHFGDTYRTMLDRKVFMPRIHAATKDGTATGEPVLFSAATWEEKKKLMGPYVLSCQMLQNPVAGDNQIFKLDWLRYYDTRPPSRLLNIYILVDPANAKKKDSDFTVMLVVGLGRDNNYYLLDGVRSRLNLTERTAALFTLVRRWQPLFVAYQQYGIEADVQHVEYVMDQEHYRFTIRPVSDNKPKPDRIRRLVPLFTAGRMWLPVRLLFSDHQGEVVDLIVSFRDEEFLAYPVAIHDDILDDLAGLTSPSVDFAFPKEETAAARSRASATTDNHYNPVG
jgi:phage terminase large subunit-like protein